MMEASKQNEIEDLQESSNRTLVKSIIEKRYDDLYRFALSLSRDSDQAKDICQDACIIALRRHASINDPEKIQSWLFGIIRNVWLNRSRALERDKALMSHIFAEASIEALTRNKFEYSKRAEEMRKRIGQLPWQDREILRLQYQHHLEYQEISSYLGLPISTVNNRIHAAKKRLKAAPERKSKSGKKEMKKEALSESSGRVLSVQGYLWEIEFDEYHVPDNLDTIEIANPNWKESLRAVVAEQLEGNCVRAISDQPVNALKLHPFDDITFKTTDDRLENLPDEAIQDVIKRLGSQKSDTTKAVEIGIKGIDLLCPLPKQGNIGLFAPTGVGKLISVEEIYRRLTDLKWKGTIFVFQSIEEQQIYSGMRSRFCDDRKELHHYYRPDNERISCIYILKKDRMDEAWIRRASQWLDASIALSVELALLDCWPPVDPELSKSKVERFASNNWIQMITESKESLLDKLVDRKTWSHLANQSMSASRKRMKRRLSELSDPTLLRQVKTIRYLGTPYYCAERWTKKPGAYIARTDTISDLTQILEGECDAISQDRFTTIGRVAEASKAN